VRSSWCWSFLSSPPAANRWIRYGRLFAAIGGKRILADDTSCSRAPNATAQCVFCMLAQTTASSFSVATNALASPIRPRWATDGTVASYREVARSAQMGSGRHYADQAARHARENVPTYFRDAGVSRGRAKAGGGLRSKLQARSASCPTVAAMPK
jgi:hypothetical protein